MTWQNLPCAPTLPALFAACPHGWAEIEFTYQRGNPTADPPQDADCSLEVRRLWGIENADEPALVDLLEDLGEPPLGMPHRDCILLARMEHHAGPCGTCMREPDDEHRPGDPCPRGECGGEFTTEPRLRACWGDRGKPVVFVGSAVAYDSPPSMRMSWTTPTVVLSDAAAAALPTQSRTERRETLIVTSTALSNLQRDLRRIDTPHEDEVMRTLEEAHSAVEEQIRVLNTPRGA